MYLPNKENYVDKSLLDLLVKKKRNIKVLIIGNNQLSNLDIKKFNEQYPLLETRQSNEFHDRWIIIDNETIYHLGASLKDLGKKSFCINKIDDKEIKELLFKKIKYKKSSLY